jgi:hypothetical protein
MNREQLIDKLFNSGHHKQFSRSNSFFYRQQHYPELIIDIRNNVNITELGLCCICEDLITLDDFFVLKDYEEFFRGILIDQNLQVKNYIVMNIDELDYCYGIINEFPDYELIFFGKNSQKTFFNREVYEF